MGGINGCCSAGKCLRQILFRFVASLTPLHFVQILPYLHSKSFETRTAASVALSQIFSLVPLWQPTPSSDMDNVSASFPVPEFPTFSVQELMQKGTLLLASSGKEFAKPTGILSNSTEVKKARKEAMGRLGLDFLDTVGGDEMDLEKELAVDVEPEADVEMESCTKTDEEIFPISPMDVDSVKRDQSPSAHQISATPAAPSPTISSGPPVGNDLSALSARERNRLKRKRKPGNSAFVAAPPPSAGSGAKYSATPAGPPNK
jgi:TATA-binding protein-associated factor